jgi:hypothetical protein
VTEAPDRETQGDKQPEAAHQVASSWVPVIAVSLAALAVIGAATANSLPSFGGFSLPDFNQFSLPSVDRFSLPDFSRFSPPNFNRVAAPPPPNPAPVLVPDPVVRAGLRDIQSSQQQNADVLVSLTQSSATQQADLKRITRQLSLLTAQADAQQQNAVVLVSLMQNSVTQQADLKRISLQLSSLPAQADALRGAVMPLTTSSIPHSNTRAGVVGTSRKITSPLPKPFGPVSVGGAPLSPAPK